jgi:hypothetical protein
MPGLLSGDQSRDNSAWVMPHPERSDPRVAAMVRDDEVQRIAVDPVIP